MSEENTLHTIADDLIKRARGDEHLDNGAVDTLINEMVACIIDLKFESKVLSICLRQAMDSIKNPDYDHEEKLISLIHSLREIAKESND